MTHCNPWAILKGTSSFMQQHPPRSLADSKNKESPAHQPRLQRSAFQNSQRITRPASR